MQVIKRHLDDDSTRQYREHQALVALAAALVHDIGHGMFSHAFQEIGDRLDLPLARHEAISEQIIRKQRDYCRISGTGEWFSL
jgi:uncharacterized protein